MRTLKIDCGKCKAHISFPLASPSITSFCSSCGTDVNAEVFPALLKGQAPADKGETIVIDDESSCFFHPKKKAAIVCEGCGRFLCSLCDIEFKGRHLCSTCIESGAKKGKDGEMRKDMTYYDEIALTLAIFPLILFYITVITAPIALYIAIRHWNTPLSAIPRSKARFVIAIIFAGLELTGWGILLVILTGHLMK